jgi:hypothetical protein
VEDSENRLPMRTAHSCRSVFASTCRAATVRQRGSSELLAGISMILRRARSVRCEAERLIALLLASSGAGRDPAVQVRPRHCQEGFRKVNN